MPSLPESTPQVSTTLLPNMASPTDGDGQNKDLGGWGGNTECLKSLWGAKCYGAVGCGVWRFSQSLG